MNLDNWTYFNLSHEDRQFVDAFASPSDERSIIKNVPINALEQVRPILKKLRKLTGRRTYIMYRGPRNRYHGQSCTWRQDAVSFSVYWRSEPLSNFSISRMLAFSNMYSKNLVTVTNHSPLWDPQSFLWVPHPKIQKKTTP